jgi:hypothetical protein
MFKVSEFLNHFDKHKDFARTSKFEVRIAPPSGVQLDTMPLRLQCESTELPGYSFSIAENRYYGAPEPIAAFPTPFAEITLTFICAGDMWEKKLFDRWMNFIIPVNNYNPRYKDDYCTQIEISQFDGVATSDNIATQTSQRTYYAKLFGAFPISIGTLSLNWADDGIHRLPVTFRYDYWLPGPDNVAAPKQDQKIDSKPNGSTPLIIGDRGQPTAPTSRVTTPTIQPVRTLMERNFARYDKPGP